MSTNDAYCICGTNTERHTAECAMVFDGARLSDAQLIVALRAEIEKLHTGGQKKCGWCVLVHGDVLAESFPDNESCQAHVHGCEHNPLVMRTKALTGALLNACSLLDDAVQLRNDADEWFPVIANLRKVAGEP